MVRLYAPDHTPTGPDGRGWNRLSIGWGSRTDQCGLQPMSYQAYRTTGRTRAHHARWGGYGHCVHEDTCLSCPVFTQQQELHSFGGRVLVRIPADPAGPPALQIDPICGWDSYDTRWTWSDLVRVEGWTAGPVFTDTTLLGSEARLGDRAFWLVLTDTTGHTEACGCLADPIEPHHPDLERHLPATS